LYLKAYGRIYRNCGAMTEGTTDETVDGMSPGKIEAIIDLIGQVPQHPERSTATTS
jgi:hypothetical protein